MPKKIPIPREKPFRAKIRPIKKTSISDDIVDQIMSLIASGDLKPGQKLPSERELCKHFGAGRSSLREALRCLCIVGVLTARVGEGTSVALDGGKFLGKIVEWRIITEQHDIENLMEVRVALESVSAARVARLGDEEHLVKLEQILAKMETVVKDPKRFAALDLEFHVSLASASNNFLIFDLVSMIRGQLEQALSKVLVPPNAKPHTLREHLAIITAIRRRDPKAASEAMQNHLNAGLKRYQNALGDVQERQGSRAASVPTRLKRA
jgi:GntR family transcriptional repressor for pyruvate dehydrogenase complex